MEVRRPCPVCDGEAKLVTGRADYEAAIGQQAVDKKMVKAAVAAYEYAFVRSDSHSQCIRAALTAALAAHGKGG